MSDKVLEVTFNVSEEQLEDRVIDKLEDSIIGRIVDKVANHYLVLLEKQIDDLYKQIKNKIEVTINDKIKACVEQIYDEYIIQAPKDRTWNSPMVEVNLREYILEQTREKIESGINLDDGWRQKKQTLTEYFNNRIDADVASEIGIQVKKQVSDIKKEISDNLNKTFNTATKDMLSEQICNLLTNNDTYVKMQQNLRLLETK